VSKNSFISFSNPFSLFAFHSEQDKREMNAAFQQEIEKLNDEIREIDEQLQTNTQEFRKRCDGKNTCLIDAHSRTG